jgi:hypothetical protein
VPQQSDAPPTPSTAEQFVPLPGWNDIGRRIDEYKAVVLDELDVPPLD